MTRSCRDDSVARANVGSGDPGVLTGSATPTACGRNPFKRQYSTTPASQPATACFGSTNATSGHAGDASGTTSNLKPEIVLGTISVAPITTWSICTSECHRERGAVSIAMALVRHM